MTVRHMQKSRIFACPLEHTFQAVLAVPLPDLFSRRYLAIAPIAEVTGQDGEWGRAVGQTRTIRLGDGATMLETLTSIDPPNHFQYVISDLTGPLKALVGGIAGTWFFDADGASTKVTWSWDVTPKGTAGRLMMPVFARMWSGYANRAMEQIQLLLVAS